MPPAGRITAVPVIRLGPVRDSGRYLASPRNQIGVLTGFRHAVIAYSKLPRCA